MFKVLLASLKYLPTTNSEKFNQQGINAPSSTCRCNRGEVPEFSLAEGLTRRIILASGERVVQCSSSSD
jgi:hypothetical protein